MPERYRSTLRDDPMYAEPVGFQEDVESSGVSAAPEVPYALASSLYKGLGAESPEVIACEKANREHRWTAMLVMPDDTSFDGFMPTDIAICARCYVRRCDSPVNMLEVESTCVRPLNHPAHPHRDAKGYWREVGG